MEQQLAEETKVLGENWPRCHFVNNKSDTDQRPNPGLRYGKLITNCLSSCEADSRLNCKEISHILGNQTVHYHLHKIIAPSKGPIV
jgi:hypothetical protein